MKRAIIVFTFLTVFSLVGCNSLVNSPSESPLPTENGMTVSSSEPIVPEQVQPGEIDLTAVVPEENYSYGNVIKAASTKPAKLNENIYFTVNTKLYVYNCDTSEITITCKDATCNHQNGKCTWSYDLIDLEQYRGKLYARAFPGNIGVIEGTRFSPIMDGYSGDFWHANGNLYVITADSSLVVFEDGAEKPRVLFDEYTSTFHTVIGRYLYAEYNSNIVVADLQAEHPEFKLLIKNASFTTDGQKLYYVPYDTNYLYQCDMDGSNAVLLVDKPVLYTSINFDEDYIYYRLYIDSQLDVGEASNDLYRIRKDNPTQQEKLATLPMPIFQIFTFPDYDKLFVTVLAPINADGNRDFDQIYCLNKDGSEITKLEIPEY